jgi:hypothetical protein
MVRQFALQIALVTHDDAIAQNRLRDFKPDDADVTADTLRLFGEWSTRHGNGKDRQRAMDRLDAMRQAPLRILAEARFDQAALSP